MAMATTLHPSTMLCSHPVTRQIPSRCIVPYHVSLPNVVSFPIGGIRRMALSYSPKVLFKCNPIGYSAGGRLRCSPVHACINSSGQNPKFNLLVDSMKWDDKGLAVAIAQDVDTGAVLMQGFADKDALLKTISTRKATFFSRSRSTLWTKGETSSNFINVCDIFLDCDRDSLIYLGTPDGPTCHTGKETCYFKSVDDMVNGSEAGKEMAGLTTLYALESTIHERKEEEVSPNGKPSWTKRLLLDDNLLCSKIREEADELCQTLEENEDVERTASEMADVMYHSLVLLAKRGVKVQDVMQVLRKRFRQSGIEEKESRKA